LWFTRRGAYVKREDRKGVNLLKRKRIIPRERSFFKRRTRIVMWTKTICEKEKHLGEGHMKGNVFTGIKKGL